MSAIAKQDCRHAHDALLKCNCGGSVCLVCGQCGNCHISIPFEEEVLLVSPQELDSFYEGAYTAQIHIKGDSLRRWQGKMILPFINYGYLKKILERVAEGSRVLELGCGGGMQVAGERFLVTALDLSLTSLKQVPSNYQHRLRADVMKIDFEPDSFDAVFASCFYEHFSPQDKRRLLAKIQKWLRPEGKVILLFDTESGNPAFKWFRKRTDLYQQCFVEHDGHVGLEPASVNLKLFEEYGFVEIEGIGLNRTLQHLPVYTWMGPYSEVSRLSGLISGLGSWVERGTWRARAFTALIHAWDLSVGRAFPLDWSRLYLGVWSKS